MLSLCLMSKYKTIFLARPCRFGKSLLFVFILYGANLKTVIVLIRVVPFDKILAKIHR